jgi:predicted alpha/beta superfamily hydrolase
MNRLRSIALALALNALPVWGQQPQAPRPFVLEGTEVHDLHANQLRRDYQLFVGLPPNYDQQTHRYPVLVALDAEYSFPLLRSIARRVSDRGKRLDDFILVGISYARGDTPQYSRRRDYTPSARGVKDAESDMPGRAPVFGEAEAFSRFIEAEVLPFLAQRYRVDMSRKIFSGHSYGALLGVHILLTDPTMFDHYILSSPSLWFGDGLMFGREVAYAASHKDMKANVFIGAGGFETINRSRKQDPRYNTTVDMVGDMQRFERTLKSRRYSSLHIESHVIDGEDHLTVAPAILTKGLLWSLGRAPR